MQELRLKDIDPDTGKIIQDILIAIIPNDMYADMLYKIIDSRLAEEDDPNRELYLKESNWTRILPSNSN